MSFLRHIAFVGLSWACIQGATAQENTSVPVTDGQVWMSLGVGYKPFAKKKGNVVEGGFRRNFKLNGEVEWRTREWASETKQVNFTFAPEYKVTDFLKVAVQYRYALKDRYTDNVHRIGLQASLSWGTGRLKLDSRTRYEHEFKPVNKIRVTFRERLGVEYNIPHWKLDPHVSAEMFYALHYTENRLGGMRYELGTDLALDKKKKRTLGLAVRYDQEVNTVASGNAWILIFAFEGSFKKK